MLPESLVGFCIAVARLESIDRKYSSLDLYFEYSEITIAEYVYSFASENGRKSFQLR